MTRTEFAALRRMSRQQPVPEHCELCHTTLAGEHPHLLQRSNRRIVCACQACAILFSHRASNRPFLRIPRDACQLNGFVITAADWSAMRLPIDLAFFVASSEERRVIAYYPSPAGSTESLLDLEAWNGIVHSNPVLHRMEPDVEALLVNRTRGRADYFIAPIDQCYKLTGLIRRHWRGFSGGDEVWQEIEHFFEQLAVGAEHEQKVSHA
jgi:uncharacterized protein DUF5947